MMKTKYLLIFPILSIFFISACTTTPSVYKNMPSGTIISRLPQVFVNKNMAHQIESNQIESIDPITKDNNSNLHSNHSRSNFLNHNKTGEQPSNDPYLTIDRFNELDRQNLLEQEKMIQLEKKAEINNSYLQSTKPTYYPMWTPCSYFGHCFNPYWR